MSYLVGMRNTLLCFALACGLVISGCTAKPTRTISDVLPGRIATLPPYVTLHMDTDFTPEERRVAAGAADTWEKQTNGLASITLVYDLDFGDLIGMREHIVNGDNLVVRRTSDMDAVKASDENSECEACVLGWMAPAGGIHNPWGMPIIGAFVVDRLDAGIMPQVMLHEFGHTLGVPHLPEVNAIMFPSVIRGRSACLKKADLAAFCSVNECGSVKLFPCE